MKTYDQKNYFIFGHKVNLHQNSFFRVFSEPIF